MTGNVFRERQKGFANSLAFFAICVILLCLYTILHSNSQQKRQTIPMAQQEKFSKLTRVDEAPLLMKAQVQTRIKKEPQSKQSQVNKMVHQDLQPEKSNKQTRIGQDSQLIEYPLQTRLDQESHLNNFIQQRSGKGQSIMQWRKDHLARACQSLKQNKTGDFKDKSLISLQEALPWKLIVVNRFKLIGCKIAKVGSTNVARVLYSLEHLSETNYDANKIPGSMGHQMQFLTGALNAKELSELKSKLKTYTTFLFTRDPFERAISAYRDKRPRGMFKPGGLFYGKSVSFYTWLVSAVLNKTKVDKHIRPFYRWCQPCSVSYDFVGHLHTFNKDMNTILEHIGAKHRIILPGRNATGYTEKKSSSVVEKYKRNTPKHLLKQFYEKYYGDYFLFGYPRPY